MCIEQTLDAKENQIGIPPVSSRNGSLGIGLTNAVDIWFINLMFPWSFDYCRPAWGSWFARFWAGSH